MEASAWPWERVETASFLLALAPEAAACIRVFFRGFAVPNFSPERSRAVYALLAVATVALGLASRRYAFLLPPLLHKNLGDILYATMVFWIARWLLPAAARGRVCVGAFGVCGAIEFAKLIPWGWLAALRHTHAGALVLGTGFHGSNLTCYALGAGLGWAIEKRLRIGPGMAAARKQVTK